jgi:hypothetical protein
VDWVTRARPKIDRVACPWLIRRFIDPAAAIHYVPEANVLEVAGLLGGHSFDSPGADYTHRPLPGGGQCCTFETLIELFGLGGDPALTRLARIVHAADIAADREGDPLAPGLLAIGVGGLSVEADDHQLLDRGGFVYDALYAWCRAATDHNLGPELDGQSGTDPAPPAGPVALEGLAGALIGLARARGIGLSGPEGLLAQLAQAVLDSEAVLDSHAAVLDTGGGVFGGRSGRGERG